MLKEVKKEKIVEGLNKRGFFSAKRLGGTKGMHIVEVGKEEGPTECRGCPEETTGGSSLGLPGAAKAVLDFLRGKGGGGRPRGRGDFSGPGALCLGRDS